MGILALLLLAALQPRLLTPEVRQFERAKSRWLRPPRPRTRLTRMWQRSMPKGETAWRIRFASPEAGRHRVTVKVTGLAEGEDLIEWWDTMRGEVIRRDAGSVRRSRHFGYGLELKPPPFWGDIAARVYPR